MGPSAYCGGLWIAALSATCEMAKVLELDSEAVRWDGAKKAAWMIVTVHIGVLWLDARQGGECIRAEALEWRVLQL